MGFALVLFGLFVASGLVSNLLWMQLVDDIEAELPLDQRPSWLRGEWGKLKPQENVLKAHRRMYPESPKRRYWFISWLITMILFGLAIIFRNRLPLFK